MVQYHIQWHLVAIAPVLVAMFLTADYLGTRKARRKKALADPSQRARRKGLFRKRKPGFHNMKSNGQVMRDRARRREAEALREAAYVPPPVLQPPSPATAPQSRTRTAGWPRRPVATLTSYAAMVSQPDPIHETAASKAAHKKQGWARQPAQKAPAWNLANAAPARPRW